MKTKPITYGDLAEFLEAAGFQRSVVPHSHVVFHRDDSPASLLLPIERPTTHALPVHIAMARRMLIDFGLVDEDSVDRWIGNPKHHQAV